MSSMTRPNDNEPPLIVTVESNSELRVEADEQVVTETLEYTEGSTGSAYFIPCSLRD